MQPLMYLASAVLTLSTFSVGIVGGLFVSWRPVSSSELFLSCNTTSFTETILSVKWYKDGQEFLREEHHRQQSFPVAYLTLAPNSTVAEVRLTSPLRHRLGGIYRCEVATSAATYINNIQVADHYWPDGESATLTGEKDTFSIGETVTRNCSSPRVVPAPHINFYKNGEKVDDGLIERAPVTAHEDDTFSTSAVVEFRVEGEDFRPPDYVVNLRCEVLFNLLRTYITTKKFQLVASKIGNSQEIDNNNSTV